MGLILDDDHQWVIYHISQIEILSDNCCLHSQNGDTLKSVLEVILNSSHEVKLSFFELKSKTEMLNTNDPEGDG